MTTEGTPTMILSGDETFSFGKYRNQTYKSVFETDPGYFQWLSTQEQITGRYDDLNAFIKANLDDGDMSYIMRWGKHKGRSLNKIRKLDPLYIDWLRKSDFVRSKCPRLCKEVDETK